MSAADVPVQVVFDTTIMLAAAFNPLGVAMKALRLIETGEVSAIMSNRLRHEYEALLSNPAHRARYSFMTAEYVAKELDRFDTYIPRVTNPPIVLVYPRDPNDEMLINLAVAVKADYLVTLDGDMLDLPLHPDFATLPHQPRILKPGAFLTIIEQRRAADRNA